MLQERYPYFFNRQNVSVEIGMWQTHHRFYRKYKFVIEDKTKTQVSFKKLLKLLAKPTKKGSGKKNVKRAKRKKV